MGTARRAGAAWEEIDLTVGLPPGRARRGFELVLDRQKALGPVDANRTDPSPADR